MVGTADNVKIEKCTFPTQKYIFFHQYTPNFENGNKNFEK